MLAHWSYAITRRRKPGMLQTIELREPSDLISCSWSPSSTTHYALFVVQIVRLNFLVNCDPLLKTYRKNVYNVHGTSTDNALAQPGNKRCISRLFPLHILECCCPTTFVCVCDSLRPCKTYKPICRLDFSCGPECMHLPWLAVSWSGWFNFQKKSSLALGPLAFSDTKTWALESAWGIASYQGHNLRLIANRRLANGVWNPYLAWDFV